MPSYGGGSSWPAASGVSNRHVVFRRAALAACLPSSISGCSAARCGRASWRPAAAALAHRGRSGRRAGPAGAQRAALFFGRKGIAVWLLAALLHGPTTATDVSTHTSPGLPEAVTALLQIAAASVVLGLGLLVLAARRLRPAGPRAVRPPLGDPCAPAVRRPLRRSPRIPPPTRPRRLVAFPYRRRAPWRVTYRGSGQGCRSRAYARGRPE
jgi:hypothetical protein